MTGKNATPLVGGHPPADLASRLRAKVEEHGGGRGVQSAILTEALREWLDRNEQAQQALDKEQENVARISNR